MTSRKAASRIGLPAGDLRRRRSTPDRRARAANRPPPRVLPARPPPAALGPDREARSWSHHLGPIATATGQSAPDCQVRQKFHRALPPKIPACPSNGFAGRPVTHPVGRRQPLPNARKRNQERPMTTWNSTGRSPIALPGAIRRRGRACRNQRRLSAVRPGGPRQSRDLFRARPIPRRPDPAHPGGGARQEDHRGARDRRGQRAAGREQGG